MCQEVFEKVKEMDMAHIEIQLALQCAPLFMGLKTSNLLIVDKEKEKQTVQIIKNTNISYCILLSTGERTTFLLYKAHELEQYLWKDGVKGLLKQLGYHEFQLDQLLSVFAGRYEDYMAGGKEFPHEMGLFLGYPLEDVKGFIENNGKNFLYIGYWKVYENITEKISMFQKYEGAKQTILQLIEKGISIPEVIHSYGDRTFPA